MNKRDLLAAIRDAAYMQANLEAKRNQLEEDNGHLENENAEIGQFTDDGTVISKNMLRLKSERDKLARTIAESQQDFLDLQAENERLRRMVEDAELRAKTDSKHVFKNTYKILVE
jgi:chromosome segregation ATPase